MKLTPFIFGLFFVVISCNKDSAKSVFQEYQGRWILTRMSGNIPNSQTTGSEMEWQESYIFNSNGSFLKSREQYGMISSSSGIYTVTKAEERLTLELFHDADNNIIGSCLGNNKEMLFQDSTRVLRNTWNQCDGLGLEYEKAINID